jgi:hypothetical protein
VFVSVGVFVALLLTGGGADASADPNITAVTIETVNYLSSFRRQVDVTGTIACTGGENTLKITSQVYQLQGLELAIGTGKFSGSITCDGKTVPWTVTVVAADGYTFKVGQATVLLSTHVCHTSSFCDTVQRGSRGILRR